MNVLQSSTLTAPATTQYRTLTVPTRDTFGYVIHDSHLITGYPHTTSCNNNKDEVPHTRNQLRLGSDTTRV